MISTYIKNASSENFPQKFDGLDQNSWSLVRLSFGLEHENFTILDELMSVDEIYRKVNLANEKHIIFSVRLKLLLSWAVQY